MENLQRELAFCFSDADAKKARDICREEEILGMGKSRLVIAKGQDVIKLAWKEEGLRDNEVEYLLYKRASPELSRLLCPTTDIYQDGSVRQKRCQPILFQDLGKEGRDLISKLSFFGLSDAAVNIGLLEGGLVCYDYSLLSPDLLGELLWKSFYG